MRLTQGETETELTVDYGGYHSGRTSQSHIRVREFIEKWARDSRQAVLFPLWPLPHKRSCNTPRRVALLGCRPKAPPPYNLQLNRGPKQSNIAKMKEQSKASERELNDEEIANQSDGEFNTLVIKMLTELIELGRKMKEQMKDTQNEIKQNIQETNSDRKETRTQINDLEQREEINKNRTE